MADRLLSTQAVQGAALWAAEKTLRDPTLGLGTLMVGGTFQGSEETPTVLVMLTGEGIVREGTPGRELWGYSAPCPASVFLWGLRAL